MSSPATAIVSVAFSLFAEMAALVRAAHHHREAHQSLERVQRDIARHEAALDRNLGVSTGSGAEVDDRTLSSTDLEFEGLTGPQAAQTRKVVGSRLQRIDRATAETRAEADRARRALEQAVNDARRERVMESLQSVEPDTSLTAAALEPTPVESDPVMDEIDRLLGRLSGADEAERTAVEELAERAVRAHGAARSGHVAALRLEVQRIVQRVQRHEADRTRAAGLRQRIRDLEGIEIDQLDAALGAVVDGGAKLTPDLVKRVSRTERQVRAENERAYAMAVVEEALRHLGYDVESGFASLLVAEGRADFHRPEWGDHWMRARLDQASGALNFNLTRRGNATTRAAADVEHEFCSDLPGLVDQIEHPGVEIDVVHMSDPGSVPPEQVGDAGHRTDSTRHTPLKQRRVQ